MSKHGIKLMQFSGAAFQRFHADAGSLSHFSELCLSMRQKCVERRVEQPDCDRKAGHHAENPREIAALLRKQLCQRLPSALFRIGQDHLTDGRDSRRVEEHMFGAAKAHALGPKIAGSLTIKRRFGIGTDFEAANLVGRSEEHTSELKSLMRNSYAVFCLKKKNTKLIFK